MTQNKKKLKTETPKTSFLKNIKNTIQPFIGLLQVFKKKLYIKLPKIKFKNKEVKKIFKKTNKKPYKFIKTLKLLNFFRTFSLLSLLLIIFSITFALKYLPSPKTLKNPSFQPATTTIYSRDKQVLYQIYDTQNRIPVKLSDISDYVIKATIAVEDQNFYHHIGFDPKGILRALYKNLKHERLEGGSTITQQLVKLTLLTRQRTIERKLKEIILALMTEAIYSKDEILEMYLNYAPYGGTAVGIESAARTYFNKHAKDLNLAEASLLAGLPQAPSIYSPYGPNKEKAKQKQRIVLNRMVEEGFITKKQADEAYNQKLNFNIHKDKILAPHFVFFTKDLLEKEFGSEYVKTHGLNVYTTIDLNIQKMAEKIVKEKIDKMKKYHITNAGVLVVKPSTGEILAMVGSYDFFDTEHDGQVNVTISKRQPGSSIKPLLYATAFELKKLNPGSYLLDIPTCFEIPGQKPYCPNNYNMSFRGPLPVRIALGNSLNIPAVRTIRIIGTYSFVKQLKKMGFEDEFNDPNSFGLAISLGGKEVRMLDMAQAFSILANQGLKVPLTPIKSIQDQTGFYLRFFDQKTLLKNFEEMYNDEGIEQIGDIKRVLHRAPAFLIANILSDNRARAATFGYHSLLVIKDKEVSVKTGTTNDLRDNWAIGFTKDYVVVVWVGNNDNSRMRRVASGVSGATPIFHDIMENLLKDLPDNKQEPPDDVEFGAICKNGMPPKLVEGGCSTYTKDWYWIKSEPSMAKEYKKEIWIKENGLPLSYMEETTEPLKLEEHTLFSDPLTPDYCLDCNRPTDDKGHTLYEKYFIPASLTPANWYDETNQ